MGSLFWEERQKKAEGSRGRGATGNSQSPLPHIDWRQRRPLEYLLLSFVFCSFFSSSRCWEVLYLFICLLSRSSVFSSILQFTWSTISCIYEPDKEGERGRETERKRKRRGIFFLPPLFSFLPPPFIHSPFPLHRYHFQPFLSLCSPRSLLPSPPSSSSSSPPLHSLSTPNFGYFFDSTCVLIYLLLRHF